MQNSPPNARIRPSARRRYVVAYVSGAGYTQIYYDSLVASLRFWWTLRRHPAFLRVKWMVIYG